MEILIVLIGIAAASAGAFGIYRFTSYVFRIKKDLVSLAKDIHYLNEQIGDLGNLFDELERQMITEDSLDMALRDLRHDFESMEEELNEAEENRNTLYDWLGLLHASVEEVTLRANMDRNTREEILEALKEIRARF